MLAILTDDGKLRTWDPATGEPVGARLPVCSDDDHFWNLSYTPDAGKTLHVLTGEQGGPLPATPETGQQLLNVEYKDAPGGTVFSPDGIHAASSRLRRGPRMAAEPAGDHCITCLYGNSVGCTVQRHGSVLATSGNGVRVWDLCDRLGYTGPATRAGNGIRTADAW